MLRCRDAHNLSCLESQLFGDSVAQRLNCSEAHLFRVSVAQRLCCSKAQLLRGSVAQKFSCSVAQRLSYLFWNKSIIWISRLITIELEIIASFHQV